YIHVGINGYVIYISKAVCINFHFGSIWSNPEYPSSKLCKLFTGSIGCVVKPKIPYSDIDPTINAHSYPVGSMVCTTTFQKLGGTNALYYGFGSSVGDTIPIFIVKNDQVHSVSLPCFGRKSGV